MDDARELSRNRVRTRIEAILLEAGGPATHKLHGRAKHEFLGRLSGTVLEIGPGTGANLRYYAPGVRVVAAEPNRLLHDRLRAAATEHGVDLDLRDDPGEALSLADDSVDAAVGTLVLCGVLDPARVVAEVHRVLRPGATWFFVEHVAAEPGTPLRRAQDLLMPVHRWAFNGCVVNRDAESTIRSAAPWSHVAVEPVLAGWQALHVRTQVRGYATK